MTPPGDKPNGVGGQVRAWYTKKPAPVVIDAGVLSTGRGTQDQEKRPLGGV
jgi:hypothetical protein